MNARMSRFVFVALVITFLVASSAGAWMGLYEGVEVVASGDVVRVLYLQSEDGYVRRLTEGTGASWTPDGEVAYDGGPRGALSEIRLIDADGGNDRFVTNGTYSVFTRNFIAFNLQRGNRTFVAIVSRTGGDPTLLGFGEERAAINPDQSIVVFDDGSTGLVVSPIGGGGVQPLVPGFVHDPVFLSDGRLLYVDETTLVPEIRVMDVVSGVSFQVVKNAIQFSVSDNDWIVYLPWPGNDGMRAVRPDGTGDFGLGVERRAGFQIFGNLYPPDDTRAVQPPNAGTYVTTWGRLKRQ